MAGPSKKRPSLGGSGAAGPKVKRKVSHDPDDGLPVSAESPGVAAAAASSSSASPSPFVKMDDIEEAEAADAADAETALQSVVHSASSSSHHSKDAAHRAYLAHTAPHLFGDGNQSQQHHQYTNASSSPSSSRSPSPSPSATATSRNASHAPVASSSRHVVPHKYRGPHPRDSDAEVVAPHPTLQPAPGLGAEHLYTAPNTPLNRNSWRYTFAGPDTAHLPTSVYGSIPSQPDGIRWDWSDRSAFTQISRGADVVTSDRGWRSARGNVPVREGSWYCEIQILHPDAPLSEGKGDGSATPNSIPTIEAPAPHAHHGAYGYGGNAPMKDGPHVRVGWGRREAALNAPVGFDGYSYGLRDTTGQRVFLSRPAAFASRSFAPGDTIGLYIHLPPLSKPSPRDAKDPRHIRRKWIPIRYRGQVYFEQLDYHQTREMERLLEKSWAGEKILGPDGGLKLRRVKGPTGRMGNEQGEWVEVEEGAGEDGAEDGAEGPTRTGGSGAKMKKQKAVKKASSTPTPAPGGSAASKGSGSSSKTGGKGGSGAPAAEEDKKKKRTLRSLPTLGSTSRIGFFLNGEPLGWAFQDLLDFRPLRQAGNAPSAALPPAVTAAAPKKGTAAAKKQAAEAQAGAGITPSHLDPASLVSLSTLGLEAPAGTHDKAGIDSSAAAAASALPNGSSASSLDFLSAPLLTTSASLSAIMKSRENPYDDGCCGYFPMVSLYGGARARLAARAEEMKFVPEGGFQHVERRLEEAERKRRRAELAWEKDQPEKASSLSPSHSRSPLLEEEQQQQQAADWWGQTRPLADLYPEYWQQQRVLDLEEEERAKARAKWIKTLVEEDEENEEEENVAAGGGGATEDARGTPAATPAGKKKGGTTVGGGAGGGGKGARRSYTPRDLTHTHTPTPPGATPTATPTPAPEEEAAVPDQEQKQEEEEEGEGVLADSATSPAHEAAASAPIDPSAMALDPSEQVVHAQLHEDTAPASQAYAGASSGAASPALAPAQEEDEE